MRSGIDPSYVDPDVRPQDDLFGYVNGGWWATHEIPADRSVDGAFIGLRDKAEADVRAIVEEAASAGLDLATPEGRVGGLFRSFMDVEAIESRGDVPLRPWLQRAAAVTDASDVVDVLGAFDAAGLPGLWGTYVDTDAGDPDRYLVHVVQGGIGLPDESYYRDDRFAAVLTDYAPAIERILVAAGVPDAGDAAARVVGLETAIAAGHWDQVASRDAVRTYNLLDTAGLVALAPGLDLAAWGAAAGVPDGALAHLVVAQPSALAHSARLLHERPIEDWQAWLSWQAVRGLAPYLHADLVDAHFAFFGTRLTGAPNCGSAGSAACSSWSRASPRTSDGCTSPGTSRPRPSVA